MGDRLGEANVQKALGDVQQFRADRDAALASYAAALTLFRAVGAKLGEANVLAAQSRLLIDAEPEQSQLLLEQAVQQHQAIGDVYGSGVDLYNYGLQLLLRRRNDQALPFLLRARELFATRGLAADVQDTDDLIAQAQGAPAEPDMAAVLGQLDPLMHAIAAVARGDETDKAEIEALLPQMEQRG